MRTVIKQTAYRIWKRRQAMRQQAYREGWREFSQWAAERGLGYHAAWMRIHRGKERPKIKRIGRLVLVKTAL